MMEGEGQLYDKEGHIIKGNFVKDYLLQCGVPVFPFLKEPQQMRYIDLCKEFAKEDKQRKCYEQNKLIVSYCYEDAMTDEIKKVEAKTKSPLIVTSNEYIIYIA